MKTALLFAVALSGWMCAGCQCLNYWGPPGAGPTQELQTAEEIDRSVNRSCDEKRMKGLVYIAARPGLDPIDQVYLVHRAYESLSSPESKTRLFLILIQNPSFSPTTRQQILAGLNELGSEDNRARILEALDEQTDGGT